MSTRRERAKAPAAQLNQQLAASEKAAQCERLRKKKQKNLNRWISELCTDMAKLVFAGVIIGGIFEKVDEPILLYSAGIAFLAVFLYIGYVFVKK